MSNLKRPEVCQNIDSQKKLVAIKPVRDKKTGRCWLCGKCGTFVGFEDNDPTENNSFNNYCSNCGNPVLWEGR